MSAQTVASPLPGVSVNARFLCQPFTGVQRYCYELTRRLPVASLLTPDTPLPVYAELSRERMMVRRARVRGHAWEQLVLPRVAPRGGLLWSPGGSGPLAVSRQVLTIHDIAHLEQPQWYSRKFAVWYRALLPLLARRAQRILTVSEFSRGRIVHHLGIPAERVVATPLGVDPRFRVKPRDQVAAGLHELGIEGRYVLAVAAESPRKNFQRLYAAWTGIAESIGDVRLVVVGKTGLAFSGDAIRRGLPVHTRVFEHVPDEALVDLYNGAETFVYPSLYEGFGLPVLEAMACGTPVISSNITSVPEVAGNAALLIDPYDTDAIARAILQVLQDGPLQEDLRQRGLERVRPFTWDRTAALTWDVLSNAAARG